MKKISKRARINESRGVALIIILWILFLLTVLSIGLSKRLYWEKKVIKNRRDFLWAKLALDSATQILKSQLNEDSASVPALILELRQKEKATISIAESQNVLVKWSEAGESLSWGIGSSESKVNLNLLPPSFKENLLYHYSIDEDLLARVLDWIDADHDPYNNGDGYEKEDYNDPVLKMIFRDGPFQDWEELFFVEGMNNETFEILKKRFTINGSGKVDIHFASIETLQIMGLSLSFAEKINNFISGDDLVRGNEDDRFFSSPENIAAELEEWEPLLDTEASELNKVLPWLICESNVLQAILQFENQGRMHFLKKEVLFQKEEEEWVILKEQWIKE